MAKTTQAELVAACTILGLSADDVLWCWCRITKLAAVAQKRGVSTLSFLIALAWVLMELAVNASAVMREQVEQALQKITEIAMTIMGTTAPDADATHSRN